MSGTEISNASQYGKIYYARHMVPGLCGYEDETVLVNADTMKRMAPTFDGKPIYVLHDNRTEEERVRTLQETAHGYVTETFYNELDGWLWSKMVLVNDDALAAIGEGWAVSNAYVPLEFGEGGLHNNLPFDRQIVNAKFTHLALVPNPRYEAACVMTPDEFKIYQERNREQLNELRNSKTEKKGYIMKLFKTKKEEVSTVDADTLVEMTNAKGETVEMTVQEMVNAVEAHQKAEAEKQKGKAKIKVGEKDMTIEELVNAVEAINAKKNSDDEKEEKEEKDNESDEDDEMDNESDKDDTEKDEKDNSLGGVDHFKELSNANKKAGVGKKPRIENNATKLQRGQSRYGTTH